MKSIRNFLAVVMSVMLLLPVLPACGVVDPDSVVDGTKSQLYIGNLYAGFRDEWLQGWKNDFETMYAETEFEPGKKGVQIHIDNQRDAYSPEYLLDSVKSYDKDMYFTEDIYLYDYIAQDVCADITDMVTEDLSGKYDGESGSIEAKMDEDLRSYYKVNGKYYMLPFYESTFGIQYDRDLFYDKSFFISKNSTITTTVFTKNDADFSAGVDGVQGTFDDGLPATYAQFYDLLAKMKESNITPFVWSGKQENFYGNYFMNSVWTANEGYEQRVLDKTFSGDAKTLVDTIETKSKTYRGKPYDVSTVTLQATPTAINTKNAYMLQKQAGKYYALQFVKNIVRDTTNYDSLSTSSSLSHTSTQSEFLKSCKNKDKNRIAMLLDGSWWRAEAKQTFSDMVNTYNDESLSMKSRRFGFMPVPKPTQDMLGANDKWTIETKEACVFISSTCENYKLALAKKFLQFCFTNKSLKFFTTVTETHMPYNYGFASASAEKEFVDSLTVYGQDIWSLFTKGEKSRAVSNQSIFINNHNYFQDEWKWQTSCTINRKTVSTKFPFAELRKNEDLTAKIYFEGLYEKHSQNSIWG